MFIMTCSGFEINNEYLSGELDFDIPGVWFRAENTHTQESTGQGALEIPRLLNRELPFLIFIIFFLRSSRDYNMLLLGRRKKYDARDILRCRNLLVK